MRFLISLALGLSIAPFATAQVDIGGLDSSRCRPLSTTGPLGYDALRTELLSPGFASTAGFAVNLVPETDLLDATYLAGVDILFVGDGAGPLSAAEATAVSTWHASGGALLVMADSVTSGLAASVLAAIGSTSSYGAIASCTLTGNPVASFNDTLTNGPFGDLRGQELVSSPVSEILGAQPTDTIAECSAPAVLYARHGAGAVNGPSSGRVVFSGDALFIDVFVDPAGSLYSPNHLVLALNSIAYLEQSASGIGTAYCQANPNSTGATAAIAAVGSPVVSLNDVTLRTSDMPANTFGYYLVSSVQGLVINPGGSSGNLCLGGSIGRYAGPGQVQNSGSAGEISLAIDLTRLPTPTGFVGVMSGDTYNFTTWFRDAGPMGATTSNFSNGLEVNFL